MKRILITSGLLVLFALPVFAERTLKPGVTPDSIWYGFDRVFEQLKLLFVRDPQAVATYQAELAEERIAEAFVLAQRNKTMQADALITESESLVESAVAVGVEEEKNGRDVSRLRAKLESVREDQQNIIGQVRKAPEPPQIPPLEVVPVIQEPTPVPVVAPELSSPNLSAQPKSKVNMTIEYDKIGGAGLPAWKQPRQTSRSQSDTLLQNQTVRRRFR